MKAIGVWILFLGLVAPLGAMAATPHILLILADDLGYGDIHAFNNSSKIETPNIDRLAARGMRFTDAHAAGSTCVPSRYGLLTGRYPVRASLDWKNGPVIEEKQVTLASYMSALGYTSAMVGKWHQGLETVSGDLQFDYAQPLLGGPLDRGFQAFFGMHASLDIPPYFYIHNRAATAVPNKWVASSGSEGHPDGWNHIQGAFWRGGLKSADFKHDEVTPRLVSEATHILKSHRDLNGDQPLFLYLALPSPHTPWLPAPPFLGQSGAGMYGDFVMQVDDAVGQLMAALEEGGLSRNTLVFFSSDNGPVWYDANRSRFGHDSSGGFRGMKGDVWEGGHRVPLVIHWPGHIEAGSVNDQLVSLVDVLSTLADVTQIPLPPGAAPDGISFYPALEKRPNVSGRTSLPHDRRVIRSGRWKLIRFLGSGGFTPPRFESPEAGATLVGQLYDLKNDPGETENRYLERPDVVARLSAELDALLEAGE